MAKWPVQKQTHRTAKTKAKQQHAEHHDPTDIPKTYFFDFYFV